MLTRNDFLNIWQKSAEYNLLDYVELLVHPSEYVRLLKNEGHVVHGETVKIFGMPLLPHPDLRLHTNPDKPVTVVIRGLFPLEAQRDSSDPE